MESGPSIKLLGICCRVLDRHPIHGEPTLLEIVDNDHAHLVAHDDQLVQLFAYEDDFTMTHATYTNTPPDLPNLEDN